jgi:hypothetical protein
MHRCQSVASERSPEGSRTFQSEKKSRSGVSDEKVENEYRVFQRGGEALTTLPVISIVWTVRYTILVPTLSTENIADAGALDAVFPV